METLMAIRYCVPNVRIVSTIQEWIIYARGKFLIHMFLVNVVESVAEADVMELRCVGHNIQNTNGKISGMIIPGITKGSSWLKSHILATVILAIAISALLKFLVDAKNVSVMDVPKSIFGAGLSLF
eukprot:Phypoly_transcript_08331.p2 GENE.Phypoly_transcript_08331~~Phypoly_transcript_08331.p2  ORF type:complete len:126 (+),score=8.79 Phypoly_transcript_08331:843-1220(+)